jgi:glyoxylase-like metal-dependent hydrolase (beta-lactamase superfamily II)
VPHDALHVGEIEVVPLCDARVPFAVAEEFPVQLPEGWGPFHEAYPWAFLGVATWDYHVHALVVRTPDAVVLIDTGIGIGAPASWGGVTGSLAVELAIAHVQPTEVEHVVHTHLHLDHIGGATTDDGEPRFPFARHHVHLADWETFLDAEDPDDRGAFERSIRPLADRDMLDVTADDREIVTGVSVLHAPGHTPGHRAVLVQDGHRRLMITGDALHHPFQVTHSDWPSTHDTDPTLGVKTRTALLGMIRDEGLSACVPHFAMPFGGVNSVRGVDRWTSIEPSGVRGPL